MSAVVRASITVTPGIPIIAATIFSGSASTTGGYVNDLPPPWNPKRHQNPVRFRQSAMLWEEFDYRGQRYLQVKC